MILRRLSSPDGCGFCFAGGAWTLGGTSAVLAACSPASAQPKTNASRTAAKRKRFMDRTLRKKWPLATGTAAKAAARPACTCCDPRRRTKAKEADEVNGWSRPGRGHAILETRTAVAFIP